MHIYLSIEEIAVQSKLFEIGYVDIGNLKYHSEVRTLCERNSCRNYGTSWACPPAIGTIAECRERVKCYAKMLLFSKKYQLEDSFDFENMKRGLYDFKQTVDIFDQNIKNILSDYLLLSNEGCKRCAKCTYPNAQCRFPAQLYHSLEGYGFIVSELAREAGIHYNNGTNTVTFFGALLFNY